MCSACKSSFDWCTSCAGNRIFDGISACNCPTHYTDNGGANCVEPVCHYSCETCESSYSNGCTTCDAASHRL